MKQTLFSLFSLSLLACGTIDEVDTGSDADRADQAADFDLDLETGPSTTVNVDDPTEPPPPPPAITLEAPRAATTEMALSSLGFSNHGALLGFIRGDGTARDVSEQRFVTAIAEPVTLRISLATPTVQATRTIATDTGERGAVIGDLPKCSTNNDTILLAEPKCNRDGLSPAADIKSNTSTAAQWNTWVFDEQTNAKYAGCTVDGDVLLCALPGEVGHGYRVVTSVNRVSELWDGATIAVERQQGREFIGRFTMARYCQTYDVYGGNSYCTARYEYQRPRGLDGASLTFSPIVVSIVANGDAYGAPIANLTWGAGTEDFPGPTY